MKKKILLTILSGLILSFAFATTAMAGTMTVVSDTSVNVYGPLNHYAAIDSADWGSSASAVVTWKHPSWPTITGATWISSAYYTELPRPDSWRLFSDVIELPSCATNIAGNLISVTSDNAEEVYLNGTMVGSDGEVQGIAVDNQEWKSVLNYPLTGLQAGTNALKIIVRNYAYNTDSPTVNPTGLIYKANITYNMRAPSAEICDGIDNDCDGEVDEDYVNTPTSCGVGACAVTGEMTCVGGVEVDTCTAGSPAAETCDNIDNDCDGTTDEELTQFTSNQNGLCEGNAETCNAGKWIPNETNYTPVAETCDGLDNNCDGTADEELDTDNDGVYGCMVDKCLGTVADTTLLPQGTNRWIWNGTIWQTVKPKGTGPSFTPTFSYTYGCSCTQMLDSMKLTTGFDFGGHYKYGCSKSILEDWHRGTYYIEPTWVDLW